MSAARRRPSAGSYWGLQSTESLRSRDGALPGAARSGAGRVDDGRGRAGQRAAVEARSGAGSDLLGNVAGAAGIGPARKVRARRDNGADLRKTAAWGTAELRDADA